MMKFLDEARMKAEAAKARFFDDSGAHNVSHLLIALVVCVIGVLILVALLPVIVTAITDSGVNGSALIILGLIPLIIVAAVILWVLKLFEIL